MFDLNEHSDIKFLEINSICDFLNENFCKQITNRMLAEKFHYHPYYLNRIFKEKIGVTIHRYIIECRITEAKRRLTEEDTPISVIAVECGFATISYFSRQFKSCVGVSPTEYRNK